MELPKKSNWCLTIDVKRKPTMLEAEAFAMFTTGISLYYNFVPELAEFKGNKYVLMFSANAPYTLAKDVLESLRDSAKDSGFLASDDEFAERIKIEQASEVYGDE